VRFVQSVEEEREETHSDGRGLGRLAGTDRCRRPRAAEEDGKNGKNQQKLSKKNDSWKRQARERTTHPASRIVTPTHDPIPAHLQAPHRQLMPVQDV
jgi:hypothetical protein